MKITALVIVLSLTLFAPAFAQSKKANRKSSADQEAAEISGLKPLGEAHVYKKAGERNLHLYVTKPEGWKADDKRPAIVFYHGGGWMIGKGTPTQFNYQGKYLASRGMVSIQVEYRLVADNRKEAPLDACRDAKSAMRWVRSHAAELGIDPKRIASGGGSAGGHLAAFVGMVEGTDDPQDNLKISCLPNAMVLYNPALLHEGQASDEGADAKKPKASAELIAAYTKISPFVSVSAGAPPGIILVGDQDAILPVPVVKKFQEKCRAVGTRMDAVIYPGEGHSFFGLRRSFDRFYDTTIEMDKFLGSLGWLNGPPTLTKEDVKAYAADAVQSSAKKKAK
ncbi:MAG TPA: alpha/beta hydrolase [Verrucomicrobiae bacterium]